MKDYTVVDLDMVKKTAGVLGCQETGGQLQIIVGTNARDVCIEFCKLIGAATTASMDIWTTWAAQRYLIRYI